MRARQIRSLHRCILWDISKLIRRERVRVLTTEGDVWLWCVHAKLERVENSQVSGTGSSADAGLGVVDQKRVLLGQEGLLAIRGVLGVPYDLCFGCRLVDSNGVGGLVGCASGENVDSRGRLGQRGEVPGKGHEVADLVELGAGERIRRDQGDASCRQAVVVALGLGCGLAARGLLRAASAGLSSCRGEIALVAVAVGGAGAGLGRLGWGRPCGLVAGLLF